MAHKFHRDDATFSQVDITDVTSVSTSGFAKAWAEFNSLGSVFASYNISGIVSNAAGDLTLTFTTPMTSSSYAFCLNATNSGLAHFAFGPWSSAPTSTSFRLLVTTFGGTATSTCSNVSAVFFGT